MVTKKMDSVEERQLYSAVGQAKLINRYFDLFREHGIAVGQVLTMKENFSSRSLYLNQRHCMGVMLDNGVIPIINENDTVSVTELMFTDNDELSGLVSTMMDCDALVILSNIDGLYTGRPGDAGSELIRSVSPGRDLSQYIQSEKSGFGRGGMITKSGIAQKVAQEGIPVFIANGKRDDILTQLFPVIKRLCDGIRADELAKTDDVPFTLFLPSLDSVSSVKKWIAHSDGFSKGTLYLNSGASSALLGDDAASLLPIGITKVDGDFERHDIVSLVDANGKKIGVGRSEYDSDELKDVIGEHGKKVAVHYDYLYLENGSL
jgi:glutamate 5-kinase